MRNNKDEFSKSVNERSMSVDEFNELMGSYHKLSKSFSKEGIIEPKTKRSPVKPENSINSDGVKVISGFDTTNTVLTDSESSESEEGDNTVTPKSAIANIFRSQK